MGNKASSPVLKQAIVQSQRQLQAQNPAPPTPNPVAECTAKKIRQTDLERQLDTTRNDVDRCDPSAKNTRQSQHLQKTNTDFVNQMNLEYKPVHDTLAEEFKMAQELTESVRLLKQYETKLRKEESQAIRKITQMEHAERASRRDFLDSGPTDGVPWHVFGFQTSDDKVMLTFWITSLITFSLLTHVALTMYMPNSSLWTRVKGGSIIVIAALVVSYMLITKLG